MRQSTQARYDNPNYAKGYCTVYYNIMLKHLLVGTESYITILSMFPGGEIYDVSKFLYDVANYKKGDKAKIIADLVALGIDGAAAFADEIIDAAKIAKRVASKTATKAIENIKRILKGADVPEIIKYAKQINKFDDYFEVIMHDGKIVKVMKSELPATNITKINNIADGAMKGLGKIAGKPYDVTSSGINKIKAHLASMDPYPPNDAMIQRLENALANGQKLEGADASFYLHELKEADLMSGGMDYTPAHEAALKYYGVSRLSVYHPDVIISLSSWFNNAWKSFWGLI
jgi:hypothetical protein